MRVLHVMEATIGGTRRHLVDTAFGQLEAGLEVELAVATARDPDFPADLERLEARGARVTRVSMVRSLRPASDYSAYRVLRRLIADRRPDVVHTHASKAGVLGRRASCSVGVGARVHTPHAFAFLFGALFGPAKRALFRQIEVQLARRTDRMIAVSPSEAETFRSSGVVDPDRVRIVPNGIDPAPFTDASPLDLSSLGVDPKRPVAAVIGLIYAAKGQDLALEALTRPGVEDLQLLVVGPGDTAELEEQARRLGVVDRVRFTGVRRDVPAILAAVDMLLLPSRWEGMPYVILEAMASSRAVVATPVDWARDLVLPGETGVIAAEISAAAIAEGLAEVCSLGAEGRARMGAAGRERVMSGYTATRMVEGLLEVYGEVG